MSEDERITRTEVIADDKEGTLKKVYFPEHWKMVPQKDGTEKAELVEPWEIRATGKKTNELRGVFKGVKDQMLHESAKQWEDAGGDLVISKPDGSTDTVRADMEDRYRQIPGFCLLATKPTLVCDVPWEGSMKRRGLRYHKSIMRNGELVTVEER